MQIDEMRSSQPLPEMWYSRKKAETVITGLEKPINDHLLKLLVVDDDQNVKHWRAKLLEWLDEVAEIRLKPENKLGPASFYYRILFDEPFGGTGMMNIARRIRRLERQSYTLRKDIDLNVALKCLRKFHQRFSDACSHGIEVDQIEPMVDQVISRSTDAASDRIQNTAADARRRSFRRFGIRQIVTAGPAMGWPRA